MMKHNYRTTSVALCLAGLLLAALWRLTALGNTPTGSGELLAIYALAFDNDPAHPAMSLAATYTPTVQGIISATAAPGKTAVILADLDGYGDTRLLIAQRGVITTVVDWPHALAQYASNGGTVHELNMANGEVLGDLIHWARQNYPASATLFSFVGHGVPLSLSPPSSVQGPNATATPQPTSVAPPPPPLNPLPSRWIAHRTGLTDYHSGSLLSLQALDTALQRGTANGAQPLTLLDLLHCFSASIEELYQVHPYAEMIAAAPNYAYSQPAMLGLALTTLQPTMSARQMADVLVQTYDGALPVEEHPRLLVAVESQKLAPIKEAWDRTAYHLQQALLADPAPIKAKIIQAYASSAKYDTTLCAQQEWALAPPDALSDMADFAQRLGDGFGADTPIGAWAITTTQRISAALVSRAAHNGVPWFAENEPPPWQLNAPGIALFTDFAPEVRDGRRRFSWQAAWYKSSHPTRPATNTVGTNPEQPIVRFLVGGYEGVNWADLFQSFWENQTLTASDCLPSFLYSRGANELTVVGLHASHPISTASVRLYHPLWLTVTVQSVQPATNPLVRLSIYRGPTLVYADVLGAGYLTGQQPTPVRVRQPWTPVVAGEYQIVAEVDIDQRFDEADEADNRQTLIATVGPPAAIHLPIVLSCKTGNQSACPVAGK